MERRDGGRKEEGKRLCCRKDVEGWGGIEEDKEKERGGEKEEERGGEKEEERGGEKEEERGGEKEEERGGEKGNYWRIIHSDNISLPIAHLRREKETNVDHSHYP